LKPNQTDQDTLPPYGALDTLLTDYLEKGVPIAELEKRHGRAPGVTQTRGETSWVRETIRRIEWNEYKRRQAAPVLKISHKAFGIGRRIPVAKHWDHRI
jgi:NH3-dependent NAD+ synthetase